MTSRAKKPEWLRVRLPNGAEQERFKAVQSRLRTSTLHTVCEEARCPNIFECWGQGTATIMILGDVCTRGCRFCSVKSGHPGGVVDPLEPTRTARALAEMQLAYVVLTMVDRDDLSDGGAAHVVETLNRIREYCPELVLETLVGDFQGDHDDVRTLIEQGAPDVFAHNVEVVPRLQRSIRDARCSWSQSVDVLRFAKEAGAKVTKSSLMVGLGEQAEEVKQALSELRAAEVDVVTIGQYLQPTKRHALVEHYVTPEEFEGYRKMGEELGFRFVASGPLVRSSYRAAEAFLHGVVSREKAAEPARVNRYGRKRILRVVE